MTQITNFKNEIILNDLFQKIEAEGSLPNSYYKASITLISKSDKDSMKKTNILHAENLDQILANRI